MTLNHEVHETSWNSLLTVSSSLVDQKLSFSPAKIKALKQIVSRLPARGAKDEPNTPNTYQSNVERRRKLKKFGQCKGQHMGKVEPLTQKMPKMKLRFEPKFAGCLPASPRTPRTGTMFVRPILTGGVPSAVPVLKRKQQQSTGSPRTPRAKIRCRHCKGGHWSHSCPNRIRENRSTSRRKTNNTSTSILSDAPPTKPGPKKKKYKFDFKVRTTGFQRKNHCKWLPSPRFRGNKV